MPVQRCTLPLPITLLPLCAVRPVQSLSACTTVHFNFTYTSTPPKCRTACTEPQCLHNGALYLYLYLYSLYVPYGLYRTSVPVQQCTLPLPIPLLPVCAVRPVQSLSARTTVHFLYNLRMGRVISVGIESRYKLGGRGSKPGEGEIFPNRPDRTWGLPSLLYNG